MNLAQIIDYRGSNDYFAFRHECEDFNTMSQLIVRNSQEAIVYGNGQAIGPYTKGRHTLTTENIPFLRHIRNLPTGGKTPFKYEVYFINMVSHPGIKWGVSGVQFREAEYGFPLKIGASGDMSIEVCDSRKLVLKLVGTEDMLTQEGFVSRFREIVAKNVRCYIAEFMRDNAISIFDLDGHLNAFSDALRERISPDFLDYGVSLLRFNVSAIARPDGDIAYERYKNVFLEEGIGIREARVRQQKQLIQQETDSQRMLMESRALAQKREQEGYSWSEERGMAFAEALARNAGVGNITGMGMGFGVMGGIGASVARVTAKAMGPVSDAFTPAGSGSTEEGAPCPAANDEGASAVPDAPAARSVASFEERLAMLEKLKGKIPEEMYQAKLKELVDNI